MRHWEPRIAGAVEAALELGHDALVGLVLAPHWSSLSIAKYEQLFDAAVAGASRRASSGSGGGRGARGAARRPRPRVVRDRDPHVVFTAHSLPARILESGDPYRDSLLETSRLVADRASIGDRWSFAFQSESPTGEPWLGPTSSTTSTRSRTRASTTCSPAPSASSPTISRSSGTSTSRRRSGRGSLGLRFSRIEMPNADPAFVDVLAGIVRHELAAVTA